MGNLFGFLENKKIRLEVREVTRILSQRLTILFSIMLISVGFAFYQWKFKPNYSGTTTLFIQSQGGGTLQKLLSAGAPGGGMGGLMGESNEAIQRYMTFLQSEIYMDAVAKAIVESPKGLPEYVKNAFFKKSEEFDQSNTENRIAHLSGVISSRISVYDSGMGSIEIQIKAKKRSVVKFLAGHSSKVAIKVINNYEEKELNAAESYLTSELNNIQQSVDRAQEEIVNFKKETNTLSVQYLPGGLLSYFESLKAQMEKIDLDIAHVRMETEKIHGKNEGSKQTNESGKNYKFGLKKRLESLRDNDKRLKWLRAEIRKKLDTIASSREAEVQQGLLAHTQKIQMLYESYAQVKRQLVQLEVQRILVKHKVQQFDKTSNLVINRASVGRIFGFAIFIAIMSWISIVYLLEVVFQPIRNIKSIRFNRIGNIGVYERMSDDYFVELFGKKRRAPQKGSLLNGRRMIDSLTLKLDQFLGKQEGRGSIVTITPSGQQSGASLLSRNTAASYVNSDEKVLLIDATPDGSGNSKIFAESHSHGFYDIVRDSYKFGVNTRKLSKRLDFLCSGESHECQELIRTEKMSALLEDLRVIYDKVIIETSPVDEYVIAGTPCCLADMAVLVVDRDKTYLGDLKRSIGHLNHLGCKKITSVLNKVSLADVELFEPKLQTLNEKSSPKKSRQEAA